MTAQGLWGLGLRSALMLSFVELDGGHLEQQQTDACRTLHEPRLRVSSPSFEALVQQPPCYARLAPQRRLRCGRLSPNLGFTTTG